MFWLWLFFCWLNWMDLRLHVVDRSSSRIMFSWAESRRKEHLALSQPGNIMSRCLCLGHNPSWNECLWPREHAMPWCAMPEPPVSSFEKRKVEQNHLLSGPTSKESKDMQSYTLATFSMNLIFWEVITLGEMCSSEIIPSLFPPISALENREGLFLSKKSWTGNQERIYI